MARPPTGRACVGRPEKPTLPPFPGREGPPQGKIIQIAGRAEALIKGRRRRLTHIGKQVEVGIDRREQKIVGCALFIASKKTAAELITIQIADFSKGIAYIPAIVSERFFMKPCNGVRRLFLKGSLQVKTIEHNFCLVA